MIGGERPERIGFIGLGNQGLPIARRIAAAGWPLRLWARRPETRVAADFAPHAATPEELAATSDILGLCVVDDAGVRDLADRMLPAMAPGSLLAIQATVSPNTCTDLARRAARRGVRVIDAPVSGGAAAAAAGTLTVMMGGAPDDCDRAARLFACFAGALLRLGEVGAGQRAKLVNNALFAALLGATQAARETGAALGLEADALDRVIAASSGRSFAHEVLRGLPDPAAFSRGAALLAKDVALLDTTCAAAGISASRSVIDQARAFIARCGGS